MLDLKLLQRQPDLLAKALADRHSGLDIQEFLALDARRRNLLTQVEGLKQQRNAASTKVAELKRKGEDAAALLAESTALADRIKELDGETAQAKAEVEAWLMRVPNLPDTSVPVGKDETENVEVSAGARPPFSTFPPRTRRAGRGPGRPGF
jgi:seryl-tRNA synthetase